MQRLSLINKLVLLCVIWAMPVVFLFKIYQDNVSTTIKFNTLELEGASYLKAAWPLLHTLALRQADLSNASMPDLKPLDALDQKLRGQLNSAEAYTALKQETDKLQRDTVVTEQTMEPVLALISQVASSSNIILDPEANTYFLADSLTDKLPHLYKLYSHALDVEKRKSVSAAAVVDRARAVNFGIIDVISSNLGDDLQAAYKADPSGRVQKTIAPLFGNLVDAITAYKDAVYQSRAGAADVNFNQLFHVIIEKSNALWYAVSVELDNGLQARQKAVVGQRNRNTELVIFAVLGALALAYVTAQSLHVSLARLLKHMGDIQTGKTNTDIPYVKLKTEMGKLARGILDFRDAVKENFDNQDVMEKTVKEVRAENSRLNDASEQAISTLADALERDVGSIAQVLSTAASQLSAAAQEMKITSTTTRQQTSLAAKSSELTRQYMAVIAPSTEQLSSSIMEISSQVGSASIAANTAVQHSEVTKKQVGELTQAANKIGNIITVIGGIAAQTQLLALNATIEAARAGDAGKGFAVVATEVKTLAIETAKFAGEIDAQINEIQMATKEAVQAIESINKTVLNVSEMNTHIAAAIEEQTATTGDISRNIQTSAAETKQTADAVMSVDQAAISAEAAAEQVVTVAADVGAQANKLQNDLKMFLGNIRQRKTA